MTETFSLAGDGEIDERSSSSCNGGFGSLIKIISSEGAHEGKLHMGMSVDASRDDEFVGAIDDCG